MLDQGPRADEEAMSHRGYAVCILSCIYQSIGVFAKETVGAAPTYSDLQLLEFVESCLTEEQNCCEACRIALLPGIPVTSATNGLEIRLAWVTTQSQAAWLSREMEHPK
jgi:hypothetical protein